MSWRLPRGVDQLVLSGLSDLDAVRWCGTASAHHSTLRDYRAQRVWTWEAFLHWMPGGRAVHFDLRTWDEWQQLVAFPGLRVVSVKIDVLAALERSEPNWLPVPRLWLASFARLEWPHWSFPNTSGCLEVPANWLGRVRCLSLLSLTVSTNLSPCGQLEELHVRCILVHPDLVLPPRLQRLICRTVLRRVGVSATPLFVSSAQLTELQLGRPHHQVLADDGDPMRTTAVFATGPVFSWPVGLVTLRWWVQFNDLTLIAQQWPLTLTTLEVSPCVEQRLESWPPNLTSLTCSSHFNRPLRTFRGCPALQVLRLGDAFDRPLDRLVRWPELRELRLGRAFQHSLTPLSQCRSLRTLYVCLPLNASRLWSHLPPRLTFCQVRLLYFIGPTTRTLLEKFARPATAKRRSRQLELIEWK